MKYSLRSLMDHWPEIGFVVFVGIGGGLPALIIRRGFVVGVLLIPIGFVVGLVAWAGILAIACWLHDRKQRP